jgi:hypothetical protein
MVEGKAMFQTPSWNLTYRDGGPTTLHKFVHPARIDRMPIIFLGVLEPCHQNLEANFGSLMQETLSNHGLIGTNNTIETPLLGLFQTLHNIQGNFISAVALVKPNGFDKAFVVLPTDGAEFYSTIKRVAEIDMGISTVCVQLKKIEGMSAPNFRPKDRQYCFNMAMKCNLKGTGQNHYLNPIAFQALFPNNNVNKMSDTIVLGADVAHPLKGASKGCPSIASVTRNVDDRFVTFLGSMRGQFGRQETIDKL